MHIRQVGISSATGEHVYHVWDNGNLAGSIRHVYEGLNACCVVYLFLPSGTVHVGTFTGDNRHAESVAAIKARLNERFAPINPGLPSDADGMPA